LHQKICCLDADANDASQETHHCARTLNRLLFWALQTGLFDPIDLLSDYEDYTWDRPALLQWRLRKLELKAGHPSRRGGRQKGSAAAYSNKSVRDSERETIANAEDEYRHFVATWKQQSPKGRSGHK
jgi:hypothetical protein